MSASQLLWDPRGERETPTPCLRYGMKLVQAIGGLRVAPWQCHGGGHHQTHAPSCDVLLSSRGRRAPGCPSITETSRIQSVLFGMQNRTLGSHVGSGEHRCVHARCTEWRCASWSSASLGTSSPLRRCP
jgi:hypothetical protein